MSSTVHVVRHGEVHNPDKILYGRQPGWRLSERGQEMARTLGEWSKSIDLGALHVSPLQRAQETAAPIAAAHNISITTDERLIEAANVFEENHLELAMEFFAILQHGSIYGIHGNHRGANRMKNRSTECWQRFSQHEMLQKVRMRSAFLTSYQFGYCAVQLKIVACYTTLESVNAHLHQ